MLVSCKWCGGLHQRGQACPQRPVRAPRADAAARIRNTARWQRTRAKVRQRDGGLCRLCLAAGRITTDAVQVHHVIPLQEPGAARWAYDPAWLVCLCSRGPDSCHARAERGEVSRAELHQLANTQPTVAPTHPPPGCFPKSPRPSPTPRIPLNNLNFLEMGMRAGTD